MHLQSMLRGQFRRQLVNRQIGLRRDPALHPALYASQLAAPGIALPLRRKRSALALEPHHVVDELDRNTQAPRRLSMRAALLDKPHGTITQLNRMRLPHLLPPYLPP